MIRFEEFMRHRHKLLRSYLMSVGLGQEAALNLNLDTKLSGINAPNIW